MFCASNVVLQYGRQCVAYKYEYGRPDYCSLYGNQPLRTMFCSHSGTLSTSLPLLCLIEPLGKLIVILSRYYRYVCSVHDARGSWLADFAG